MKRTWTIGMLAVVLGVLSPIALGQDAPAKASGSGTHSLSAVPADAWGFLYVRNLGGAEKKIMEIAQVFGAPPVSPLMMAKGMLGLLTGVNDNGDLMVVVMPSDSAEDMQNNIAILVPTTDYKELTSMLQPEPVEGADGKISTIMMQGQPTYIAEKDGFAVLAPSAEGVKKILAAKAGIGGKLTAHQKERAGADDITAWMAVNTFMTSEMFKSLTADIDFAAMNLDPEMLSQITTLQVGLQVSKDGIRLGYYTDVKPGSEMAKTMSSVKGTKESLLTGLPKGPFILAFGATTSKEAAAFGGEQLGKMFDNPQLAEAPVDTTKLGAIKDLLKTMMGSLRAFAVEVSALPGGEFGFVGFSKVVTVDGDSRELLKSFQALVDLVKGGLVTDEEANAFLQHVEYKAATETLGGISVDHLTVNLDQMEDIDEEELEEVKAVIGKEGVLIRIGAVDARRVVATFGGGPARFEAVAKTAKSGEAPLAADPGIIKTSKAMLSPRTSEGYFAMDTLVRLLRDIGEALDEDPFPVTMKKVDAPAGLVSASVSANAQQTDVFIPMELIMELQPFVMKMIGAPMPPAGGQPGGQPDAGTPPPPPPPPPPPSSDDD